MMLSTVTKLKRHLGLPAADLTKNPLLETLLAGSSAYIEGQTARKLSLQEHTLKLSGDGTDTLMLPQYPIMVDDAVPAITALTLDDVNILAEIAAGDIDVDAETGILYRDAGWREGRRNITITFSAGYELPSVDESGDDNAENVPEDLEMAAIRLAARVYERRTAEGVANASPASFSVTYKDAIDEDIQEVIGRYSRMRVG